MDDDVIDYQKGFSTDRPDIKRPHKSYNLFDKFDLSEQYDHRLISKVDAQFIGNSAKAQHIKQMIQLASDSQCPILITGQTGCGKEICAKTIHSISSRKDKPFIALNCGAIPHELIESELFGHSKGSFTGAHQDHIGLFEQANGGTLFLDEIGEMPLSMQVKLLRLLEDGIIRKIGDHKEKQTNVRIIAATNQHITHKIDQGRFRSDLYYRISILSIDIPTLVERRDDIKVLTQYFTAQLSTNIKLDMGHSAWQALIHHDWPGNVRELRNWVSRALLFSRGKNIDATKVKALIAMGCHEHDSVHDSSHNQTPYSQIVNGQETFDLKSYIINEEKKYMRIAMRASDGMMQKAAQLLGMKRTTFVEKMKRYELTEYSKK